MRLDQHPDPWVRRWTTPLGALVLFACLALGAWSMVLPWVSP